MIVLSKGLVGTFADIERHPLDDSALSGFILDVSDDLALLHYVSDAFHLDGYCVIRNSDITACNVFDSPDCFQNRALRLKNVRPKRPRGVNISNWATVLQSAGSRYPLLVLHREEVANDACIVGRVVDIDPQSVTLQTMTPNAAWDKQTRVLIADVTRLDFGGGYEDALWKVSAEDEIAPD